MSHLSHLMDSTCESYMYIYIYVFIEVTQIPVRDVVREITQHAREVTLVTQVSRTQCECDSLSHPKGISAGPALKYFT